MRILVLIVAFIIFSPTLQGQEILKTPIKEKSSFLKDLYTDFLKYGTVYGAGDISNSIEAAEPTFFLRTNQDGSLSS